MSAMRLLAGGQLDAEHPVLSAELVLHSYDATHDTLPASSTGTCYAANALIGSTLFGIERWHGRRNGFSGRQLQS